MALQLDRMGSQSGSKSTNDTSRQISSVEFHTSNAMKRKPATPICSANNAKRRCGRQAQLSIPCPLLRILEQYGLLESIVTNLFPEDLSKLLCTSKGIRKAICPRPSSISNLLGKMRCSGKGVKIRKKYHQILSSEGWEQSIRCASLGSSRKTESRPCGNCGVTTCNECRIHCVYQSNFERCYEEDELHNYSGFVLLDPLEVPILSPHHLDISKQSTGPPWGDPTSDQCQPYHDVGWLDVPYETDAFGPPELIDDILDTDLGQHSFAFSAASNVARPSPVLSAFHAATEKRKRLFCDACLPTFTENHGPGSTLHVCHCTLRKHVLDRWLCVRCYEKAEAAQAESYNGHVNRCGCGNEVSNTICLWCSGTITSPEESDVT